MKSYKHIFFDVDGTIIDSKEGILNAFEYTLDYFNIVTKNKKELEKLIGPPLRETFLNYYNFKEEQVEIAVNRYREYYSTKGLKENILYSGILELLQNLKKKNKVLIIATAKPTIFTEKILQMHKIKEYFDFISGATLDTTRNSKEDIIKYALEKMNITNTEECIMVGDKSNDIIGAKKNNMESIGVTYGFGSLEELNGNGATYIANNTKEIEEIVINGK